MFEALFGDGVDPVDPNEDVLWRVSELGGENTDLSATKRTAA